MKWNCPDGKIRTHILQNVLYMNDLSVCLVSLGQLMRDNDLQIHGTVDDIELYRPAKQNDDCLSVVTFTPWHANSTIYIVSTKGLTPYPNTFISYEIAHRRFAHPGKEVLHRLRDNTERPPHFDESPPESPCKGCA